MHWTVTCPDCGTLYEGDNNRDADLTANKHTTRPPKHATVTRGTPNR